MNIPIYFDMVEVTVPVRSLLYSVCATEFPAELTGLTLASHTRWADTSRLGWVGYPSVLSRTCSHSCTNEHAVYTAPQSPTPGERVWIAVPWAASLLPTRVRLTTVTSHRRADMRTSQIPHFRSFSYTATRDWN